MKRILCTAMALLLVGCAAKPADVGSAPAAAQTPETVATPAPQETEEPAASEPETIAALDKEIRNYTVIQLPQIDYASPFFLAEDNLVSDGYYTMCQDGKWGLMKSDGTVLLPCQSNYPIRRCTSQYLRWHCGDGLSDADWQKYNNILAEESAGSLCGGEHDGMYFMWTYDIENGKVCKSAGMMGGDTPLTQEDAMYGEYLPCQRCVWVDGNGDPDYYEVADGGGYVFANTDGELLNDTIYEDAGCFYDQRLAPVKLNGKWGYIDKNGDLATEAVYEPVYGMDYSDNMARRYASPLLNGYAAVCRDGKWGVLDSTGKEYIPCEYEYAAWNGHVLWLKQNGEWQSQTLPGVPKDWTETDLGIEVYPKEMKATDRYWQVTADVGLNLRTGPGTDYDKVVKAPEYTRLQDLGHSDDDAWILTKYAGHYGWVSKEYLEEDIW